MRKQPSSDPAARERALDALALSRREGLSLTEASHRVGSDRRTVLRYVGNGYLRQGHRYVPRAFDRIPREMTVLTEDGPEEVVVRDSRTATALAEHANAVRRYRDQGDPSGLALLRTRSVVIGGERYELVTDLATLDWLIAGSELSYELYRR